MTETGLSRMTAGDPERRGHKLPIYTNLEGLPEERVTKMEIVYPCLVYADEGVFQCIWNSETGSLERKLILRNKKPIRLNWLDSGGRRK